MRRTSPSGKPPTADSTSELHSNRTLLRRRKIRLSADPSIVQLSQVRKVTIERPVTAAKLADALDCKTFELLAEMIKRAVFLAPTQMIEDDALAIELAAQRGVILRITGEVPPDDDAGAIEIPGRPPLPLHPSRQFPPGHFDSGPDPDTLSPDED